MGKKYFLRTVLLAVSLSSMTIMAGARMTEETQTEGLTEQAAENVTQAAELTAEHALAVALADAGFEESEVSSLRVEQDREDGIQIYEVKFTTESREEYEYEISVEDGIILSISYERNATGTLTGEAVTMEEAQEIAVVHSGEAPDGVTFETAKTDRDDGRTIYELTFVTTEQKKYEYDIDSETGTILEWSYDADQYLLWLDGVLDAEISTGIETAIDAVLEMAGLDADADVTWKEVHEDYEDGRLVYEITFIYESYGYDYEYEFEVDAESGIIIEWDVERVYN